MHSGNENIIGKSGRERSGASSPLRNSRGRTALAALASILSAAGCAEIGADRVTGTGGGRRAASAAEAPRPAAGWPRGSTPARSSRERGEFAGAPPRVKPPRQDDAGDPAELAKILGLNHRAIANIFGAPHSVERDGASIIWNYRIPDCALQIVFYPDIERQTFHALQYALTDGEGEEPADPRPCFERVKSENGNDLKQAKRN